MSELFAASKSVRTLPNISAYVRFRSVGGFVTACTETHNGRGDDPENGGDFRIAEQVLGHRLDSEGYQSGHEAISEVVALGPSLGNAVAEAGKEDRSEECKEGDHRPEPSLYGNVEIRVMCRERLVLSVELAEVATEHRALDAP